ncbi:DUF2169 domain-containing protein [Achromobacter seleniivolatilans]|uniref:DUF2169 domain-containing protein n=1 Tax=Achromobacter seleniivolatilans TaxID=3047478 RepID=A0ABY9M5X1_9BURK|nr:DUF2169 domain-containing protein [Achromobacter sp. R39]WMD22110.1 DUF2169 domain-containing protein [Achromobacter sp. R39]
MEFRNLTPFGAQRFGALAPDGQEHSVVVLKVGYRLRPDPDQPGVCQVIVLDKEPIPLTMADTYYGAIGVSSVLEESDLAPFKPRCDVLVVGDAHAPGGHPARSWEAALRVISGRRPAGRRGASSKQDGQTVLHKQLRVTGAREFLNEPQGWRLSQPAPANRVPLRWELAFGGNNQIRNPKHADDSSLPEFLLNEVCFSNPVGCGWLEDRYEALYQQTAAEPLTRLAAPQVEYPDAPIGGPTRASHPEQGGLDANRMAALAAAYGQTPAGFGVVGRAWAPRLALAGTYDDAWLADNWPNPPQDIDFGYWNGAPADQQIPYPSPDAQIQLLNLVEPHFSHDGWFDIRLPGHRPFVLLRLTNGVLLPLPMLTDTVRVDTDAMVLSLTHRISLPASLDIRVLEVRFEVNPDAVLLPPVARMRFQQEVV